MPHYPTVDESLDRLRRAGWSVGDTAFGPEHALAGLDAARVVLEGVAKRIEGR